VNGKWLLRMIAAFCGVVAVTTVVLGAAPKALAQTAEPTALKNVKIWVNPEYDDPLKIGNPSLLVMIEGEIVGAQPPVTIRFLAPTSAQMYSAGSKNSFGEYKGGPPDRKASQVPGYDEISYQLTESIFRVEYYVPIAQLGEIQKSFTYDFLRFYPMQNLNVTVQQPKSSDNFTVSPPGTPSIDNEGFSVQTYTRTDLDASTPVKFDISYSRSVWEPSLSAAPTTGASNSGSSSNTGLIIAIVVVAVVLGGGGVYLASRNTKKSRPVSRAERRRRTTATPAPARGKASPVGGTPAFCSQCGRKLDKPSRFCPDCGAAIDSR
jgi:hypothetical protein